MWRKFLNKQSEIILNTDPDRIYVENIRSFFHIPYKVAKLLCEMAVKERFFKKKVGVFCSNDDCSRLIKSYDRKSQIDDEVVCDICLDLEREQYVFKKEDLHIDEYYQLAE